MPAGLVLVAKEMLRNSGSARGGGKQAVPCLHPIGSLAVQWRFLRAGNGGHFASSLTESGHRGVRLVKRFKRQKSYCICMTPTFPLVQKLCVVCVLQGWKEKATGVTRKGRTRVQRY